MPEDEEPDYVRRRQEYRDKVNSGLDCGRFGEEAREEHDAMLRAAGCTAYYPEDDE